MMKPENWYKILKAVIFFQIRFRNNLHLFRSLKKRIFMSVGTFIWEKNNIPLNDRIGLDRIDINQHVVLVLSPVDKFIETSKKTSTIYWEKNIYGRKIRLAKKSYVLLKLLGHTWTVVCVPWFSLKTELEPKNACLYSKILNTKSIFFARSDSDPSMEYYFYEGGDLIERFLYTESYVQLENGIFKKPPPEIYEEDYPGEYRFYSRRRTLSEEYIFSKKKDIVVDFLEEQNSYVPAIFWIHNLPLNQPIIFEINNLRSSDIERLDYIAISN